MRTSRLVILLLFILPIVSFFLLQNQGSENITWNVTVGMLFLGVASITLLCLLWVENIDASLQLLVNKLNPLSYIFGSLKKKKQTEKNGKDMTQSSIFGWLVRTLALSNNGSTGVKRKVKGKKKTNKFETYDLRVELRIRKEWEKNKRKGDAGAEEMILRESAMQLESKRYYETDWVWRVRNYFRPRSDGLQELLDKIHDRITELDESKQEKKMEVDMLMDNLVAESTSVLEGINILPENVSDGVLSQPCLENDIESDQMKGGNPPNTV